jgi:hypothetical protein
MSNNWIPLKEYLDINVKAKSGIFPLYNFLEVDDDDGDADMFVYIGLGIFIPDLISTSICLPLTIVEVTFYTTFYGLCRTGSFLLCMG